MSRLKNDKAQYEKYLSGKMSPEEANAFERELLNDPFEQEALEGFEASDPAAFSDIEKLQAKVLKKERDGFAWMRLAAVVALLIVGSFTVWLVIKPIAGDQELAQEMEKIEDEVTAEEPEELVPSLNPKEEKSDSHIQDKRLVDGGPEIKEARPAPVETEPEEAFFESEQTAAAEIVANDFDDTATYEDEIDLEAEDQGAVALAMESKADAALQSGAPVAVPSAKDILPDTLNSIFLSQNLVAQGGELESDVVIEEASIAESLQDQAAGVQIKNSKRSAERSAIQRRTSASASSRRITGQVTDDSGEGLPGVNVVIKGTTSGVTTDLDGNFQLGVEPNSTLVISFVGFETQEVEVGNRDHVDITISGVTELQEVVVTGYGVESRQQTATFTPARPVGGNRAYKKYLEEKLNYPAQAISNEIEGTVTLELTISPNGTISNIDIKKSLGYGCDVEAIRLVNEGPKWSGSEKDGIGVEDKVKVRVKFKR